MGRPKGGLFEQGPASTSNSLIRSLPVRSAALVYVTFFRFYSLWRMHILALQSGLFPSTCFGQISAKAIAPETLHPLAASRACEGIPLVIAQEAAVAPIRTLPVSVHAFHMRSLSVSASRHPL